MAETSTSENIRKEMAQTMVTSSSRCSRGVSESMYDPYYLLQKFLDKNVIDIKSLSDDELILLFALAEYSTDVFY